MLLAFLPMIEDMKLYEFYWCFAFDGWLLVYHVLSWHWDFYDGWIHLLLVAFDGLYKFDVITWFSYPSEAYQMGFLVLTLVDPKLGLCHPNKGCSCWLPQWASFHYLNIIWCLWCQREYTYWSLSFYSSVWLGVGACDSSTSLELSPEPFLPKTYWIDMGSS